MNLLITGYLLTINYRGKSGSSLAPRLMLINKREGF